MGRGAGDRRPTGSATIRDSDPRKLAFFTGRDQSQALTGWWAQQFGTPNYAAHGGFCSVNMAAAGIYTIGGSFWEFGEPDWEHTRYFLMFGVAEDHDSNPIKIGLGQAQGQRRAPSSSRSIRSAPAIRRSPTSGSASGPGTDGLFVLALVHELLRAGKIDVDYLRPLHQRALAGDRRRPAPPMTACSRATRDGKPLVCDEPQRPRRAGRPVPTSRRRCRAR